MHFYCAQLLVVCLVEGRRRRKNTCDYPFVLYRAKGFEHAWQRALALGREQEILYRNTRGERVRWAFVKVERITRLVRNLDGREVGSLFDVTVYREADPLWEALLA